MYNANEFRYDKHQPGSSNCRWSILSDPLLWPCSTAFQLLACTQRGQPVAENHRFLGRDGNGKGRTAEIKLAHLLMNSFQEMECRRRVVGKIHFSAMTSWLEIWIETHVSPHRSKSQETRKGRSLVFRMLLQLTFCRPLNCVANLSPCVSE